MRVHFPELYEAHRIRSLEQLTRLANDYGLTYEEFEAGNWNVGVIEMEIEDNVEAPGEAPKPRRGRKPTTAKRASQAEALEAALAFVSPVESSLYDYAQHVNLNGNMAIMYNGQIAAGHPIVEELTVCPQLTKLKAALKHCGKSLALTETEAGQLSIKGEKLRVLVPCFPLEMLLQMKPDAPLITGDYNKLKEAFKVCSTLANENATRVIEASLLLNPNTCTGTNGHCLIQYWHGIAELPPEIVLPKLFCTAIASCPKNITGLGGSESSFTVWFEGGAWLKTQVYSDKWPNLSNVIDIASEPKPIAPELESAIVAIEPFLEGEINRVVFKDNCIQTNESDKTGAQYIVPGLIGGKCFNAKYLKIIAGYINQIDLTTYDDKALFFGGELTNPIRGAIMVIR